MCHTRFVVRAIPRAAFGAAHQAPTSSRCTRLRGCTLALHFQLPKPALTRTAGALQTLVDDLTERLNVLIQSEEDHHFFDPAFDAFAHIAAVTDPLKYQVRARRGGCAAVLMFMSLACARGAITVLHACAVRCA
jgi:hypothetical protein